MAERKVIFKDSDTQEELMLPVTPTVLEAESGVSLEIINISQLGDVALSGNATLSAPKLECLFPAQRYNFCCCAPLDPYAYVDKFKMWAQNGTVLRFIWSGTPVNIPVLIESIRYREDDGTNDVYASISMREYRKISAELEPTATTSAAASEPERTDQPPNVSGEQSHEIVWGDTLWGICVKYYGSGALYPQVAQYNNIKNPNLIPIGTVIKLPPKTVLDGLRGGSSGASGYSGSSGYSGVSTYKQPQMPPTVKKSYSDKILAMKEKQAHG